MHRKPNLASLLRDTFIAGSSGQPDINEASDILPKLSTTTACCPRRGSWGFFLTLVALPKDPGGVFEGSSRLSLSGRNPFFEAVHVFYDLNEIFE
jgi:hypothetical protein